MKKTEAIVFNSHGVGQYAYTDRMPVWGETISVKDWHIAEDGGKGTNVAVAMGRLGVKTAYLGKVGNDPWGDLGETWMTKAGVDCTFLYRTDEVATGTGLILIGPNGENSIIDGDSSSVTLTLAEVYGALDRMSDARYLLTGFEVPISLSLDAVRYAKAKGMITVLNPSPLPDFDLGPLPEVDFLFINSVEGNHLLGRDHNASIRVEELLHSLQDQYGCGTIVLTLGEKGAATLHQSELIFTPAVPVPDIVNTAGAGDGFMAATIAQLIKGRPLKEALIWASYYAALSITIAGTIPAYRPGDEVEKFIAACQDKA